MHVHIEYRSDGTAKVDLDGQDISNQVMRSGFGIRFDDESPEYPVGKAVIEMRLRPDSIIVEGEVLDPPEAIELLLTKALPEGGDDL